MCVCVYVCAFVKSNKQDNGYIYIYINTHAHMKGFAHTHCSFGLCASRLVVMHAAPASHDDAAAMRSIKALAASDMHHVHVAGGMAYQRRRKMTLRCVFLTTYA